PPELVLDPAADDAVLLRQIVDFYHQTLLASPEARAYLAGRGLDHRERSLTFGSVSPTTRSPISSHPRRSRRARRSGAGCRRSGSCGRAGTSTSTARWWYPGEDIGTLLPGVGSSPDHPAL